MVAESPLFNVTVLEISTIELKSVHKFSKNAPYVKLFCENYQQMTKVSSFCRSLFYFTLQTLFNCFSLPLLYESQIRTAQKYAFGRVWAGRSPSQTTLFCAWLCFPIPLRSAPSRYPANPLSFCREIEKEFERF